MENQQKTQQRTTEKEAISKIIDDKFDLSFPKFDFSTAPSLQQSWKRRTWWRFVPETPLSGTLFKICR